MSLTAPRLFDSQRGQSPPIPSCSLNVSANWEIKWNEHKMNCRRFLVCLSRSSSVLAVDQQSHPSCSLCWFSSKKPFGVIFHLRSTVLICRLLRFITLLNGIYINRLWLFSNLRFSLRLNVVYKVHLSQLDQKTCANRLYYSTRVKYIFVHYDGDRGEALIWMFSLSSLLSCILGDNCCWQFRSHCIHTKDALVDKVFSWNVRTCRKLRSDSVILRDPDMQFNDRLEWSAWGRVCTDFLLHGWVLNCRKCWVSSFPSLFVFCFWSGAMWKLCTYSLP